MRLLVLGGTSFLGRHTVTAAAQRGWHVTTFTRGRQGWAHPEAHHLIGDRLADLSALEGGRWDAVIDTWAGAPFAVQQSARLLEPAVGRYVYVSSRSVYTFPAPIGVDESCATVHAEPDVDETIYPQDKRGAEIAVENAYGTRAVLARAGLILGPHEDVGRLPWWLRHVARGGDVLMPGPRDLALQYVDARDLACWLLDAAAGDFHGAVNVVSRPGHTTMRGFADALVAATGSAATLVWVEPPALAEAGIEPWTELPLWVPPGHAFSGLITTNVDRAHATGLRCRPVAETVADTWAWLQTDHPPQPGNVGLPPEKEAAALAR